MSCWSRVSYLRITVIHWVHNFWIQRSCVHMFNLQKEETMNFELWPNAHEVFFFSSVKAKDEVTVYFQARGSCIKHLERLNPTHSLCSWDPPKNILWSATSLLNVVLPLSHILLCFNGSTFLSPLSWKPLWEKVHVEHTRPQNLKKTIQITSVAHIEFNLTSHPLPTEVHVHVALLYCEPVACHWLTYM